jgi:addiction module HigA family antidote
MSVTKAAELIGVGRPALSNLLNGNASLSTEMAIRLEKTFKYPHKDLIEMQALYDAAQAEQRNAPTNIKSYVPPFLAIKANDIEQWIRHNIAARTRLAVLLRTLINSTGDSLQKVDFPGNDDAERPGWDGLVEASEGTPWVPAGLSGWEFGTNEDIKSKADNDFNKSVNALKKIERDEITFVFVTPRRWPGKNAWTNAQQEKGLWKNVRAYDASDLEQWLEQSLPAQAWFANETRIPAHDVRSLDRCWADWSNVSAPPLSGALFGSAIEAAKRIIVSRFGKPADGPTVIVADSTEEALAFLAQLFGERGGEDLASYRDRVLVFDKPNVLPRLAEGAQTFIPVVFTRDVERELAPYANSMHSIVIYPRNATNTQPHVALEPANYEIFKKALEDMGKDRDAISILTNASGRSLTVLRRRLATVPAIQMPEWATGSEIASKLVPFMLVGAWNSANKVDKAGLELLALDRPFSELEKDCQNLSQLNDAPVWSVGTYRGVISKIDLLYAIAHIVTTDDLRRYFEVARLVLGEDDPSLDLAEDQRWSASIYGKTREFSSAFREGISETLVLLSVHGKNLFSSRLGIDTKIEAEMVIRELLPTPLTTRILEANDRDLPTYAEAAPEEFLTILEKDLKTNQPAVLGLLRPVDSDVFSHPSRTGLLWALEGLAWNPATLPRAAFILAKLAQVDINDNWVNKPTHSLESIFRAWMPQTAASHEERVNLMKKLAEKIPDVAWKLCVAQFGNHHQVGDYSHKPRWRPDAYGFGEPFPIWEPINAFVQEMVEMVLTWKTYSLSMLCDLVERMHDLSNPDQARAWELIENWAKKNASDNDKAILREKIRTTTLSRRAAIRSKKDAKAKNLATTAKIAYAALEPCDLLNKHAWLFRNLWVEESADEIEVIEKFDYEKRDDRIQELRIQALREIREHRGIDGLAEFSCRGNTSFVIGRLLASSILNADELKQLLRIALEAILADQKANHSYKNLITGILAINDDGKREAIINSVTADLSEEEKVQLLILAPFRKSTWQLLDSLGNSDKAKYWNQVTPDWIRSSDAENNEGVERLVSAGRPRAAFSCIQFHPEKIDAQVLYRLLSEMVQVSNDRPGEHMPEHYHIETAFKFINTCSVITLDQKATLEFAYIDILARPWDRRESYGIPNLERYIELHPDTFVQAVAWTYKRKDGSTDPTELQVTPEQIRIMAERGYKLLEAIERIPGHNDLDELEAERLAKWITTVRRSCADVARSEVGDLSIGKVLSNAPPGLDSVWPCETIRNVLEDIQSDDIIRGMHTGVYNSRGVHSRGEGGDQERALADKYRKWALTLQSSHPFVSSKLLMGLANTYEHQANKEDTEAGIRRRLR